MPRAVWINVPHCGQADVTSYPRGLSTPRALGTMLSVNKRKVPEIPTHEDTKKFPYTRQRILRVFNRPSQVSLSATPRPNTAGRSPKTRVPVRAALAVDAGGGEEKSEEGCNPTHRGRAVPAAGTELG